MTPNKPTSALARFLRYVVIDTRADESSTSCPSTPGQLELARLLVHELRELGAGDADVDANGYVMATLPATEGLDDRPARPIPVRTNADPRGRIS